MSLISEALKKARQEAARQDEAQRGLPYAVGAVEPPRRPWLPLVLGLVAGSLLVACVFAVAYFSGWGPRRDGGGETQVAEAAPPAAAEPPVLIEETPAPVAPATPPPLAMETIPPTAEPELSPPPPQIVIQPTSPPVATAPAPVETPVPPPAEVRPEPAPVEPPPPAVAAPPAEPKSYVGEVPVPGGGVLRLNGIAFSAGNPVAVIDGKVVGPGEIIQGFKIVEIQANRVRLEGHDTTVFVSLK